MSLIPRVLARRHLTSLRSARSAMPPTVLLSELFASVQGEGPFTGRPSIFARLGLCNLSCAWCDTPYTWLFTSDRLQKVAARAGPHAQPVLYDRSAELTRVPVEQLLRDVRELAADAIRAVVVTGGEPLLHKKPLQGFVADLIEHGFAVEFETNGTLSPVGLPEQVHLNVSPKLDNSVQPRDQRLNFDALRECVAWPSSVLKFVVGWEGDLDEVRRIVRTLDVKPERVFLMPLGTVSYHLAICIMPTCATAMACYRTYVKVSTSTPLEMFPLEHGSNTAIFRFVIYAKNSDAIREKGRWLTRVCQQHGFNYSHRVHVELWGDKRGV